MLLCQGCRPAVVCCDGRGWWTQWFLAASRQCCIVPPFQEYFFCIFTAMVSCRYRVFDPTLLPSTSMSVAYTLADQRREKYWNEVYHAISIRRNLVYNLLLFPLSLFLSLHIHVTDRVLLLPRLQSLFIRLPNEPPSNLLIVLSIILDLQYASPAFPFGDEEAFGSDNASFLGTGICKLTPAQSRYNAKGFNTSSGIASGTWVGCINVSSNRL